MIEEAVPRRLQVHRVELSAPGGRGEGCGEEHPAAQPGPKTQLSFWDWGLKGRQGDLLSRPIRKQSAHQTPCTLAKIVRDKETTAEWPANIECIG